MDRHVGPPILGRLHAGAELGVGILNGIKRIKIRRHPAAGHQLELRRAFPQLFARSCQDRIRSIGNDGRSTILVRRAGDRRLGSEHGSVLARLKQPCARQSRGRSRLVTYPAVSHEMDRQRTHLGLGSREA